MVYAADWAAVAIPIPKHKVVLGTVQVQRYLAVPLKNGKNEYDYQGSDTVACVHSIFPQMGYNPCWYVEKHREQRENL